MCYDRATYVVRCSYVFIRSTPTQGATNHIRLLSKKHSFNPRVHAGCDAYTLLSVVALIVSTHAPTKGATLGNYYHLKSVEFQPTRPRRARRNCSHRALRQSLFQPTRPRRARPRPVLLSAMDGVSTHTPTKGATSAKDIDNSLHRVSTHAPTKGATWHDCLGLSKDRVSTHAPTKGATHRQKINDMTHLFQPTRPRRARPRFTKIQRKVTSFNPRAHEGRDTAGFSVLVVILRFQPTRPRRARQMVQLIFPPFLLVSTHAPTKGATRFGRSIEG